MRKLLLFIVAVCLCGASALAWSATSQAPGTGVAEPTLDDVLKAFRADLQSSRADVMAKNLSLTAEQAAKFWPLFETYQKEQNVIMDEQMKIIQEYADSLQRLDDAGALALINGHLDRDAKMVALRQKWLGEFQKVLPAKLAARTIQIDRRLSLVHQIEFSSRIPLIR